jgi:peptide deformylase
MVQKILLLGDARLYEQSVPVERKELPALKQAVVDLHDTLLDYRRTYGMGRAIAAPQIGVFKRLIYLYIDEPIVFINPVLTILDEEKVRIRDDCMSFPNLLVDVWRYKAVRLDYRDLEFEDCSITFADDLAELLQHEYDHLDGILATMRAIDPYAFHYKQ